MDKKGKIEREREKEVRMEKINARGRWEEREGNGRKRWM